ncbi:MAG: hypothetical protein MJK11_12440 [Pseudomonadales bacterium]|nr:hypothetical protein [Pseudomonadales bacterium]
MSSVSVIKADATQNGNGGQIIVWADQTNIYQGDISAQGGSESGDGGFVEVSGKENLVFRGNVSTDAINGEKGLLLLDPGIIDVKILENETVYDPELNPNIDLDFGAVTDTYTISLSRLNTVLGESSVILEATTRIDILGTDENNIAIENIDNDVGDADATLLTSGASLTLTSATINLGYTNINLTGTNAGDGSVTLNGNVVLNDGVTISSEKGNISLGATKTVTVNSVENIEANGGTPATTTAAVISSTEGTVTFGNVIFGSGSELIIGSDQSKTVTATSFGSTNPTNGTLTFASDNTADDGTALSVSASGGVNVGTLNINRLDGINGVSAIDVTNLNVSGDVTTTGKIEATTITSTADISASGSITATTSYIAGDLTSSGVMDLGNVIIQGNSKINAVGNTIDAGNIVINSGQILTIAKTQTGDITATSIGNDSSNGTLTFESGNTNSLKVDADITVHTLNVDRAGGITATDSVDVNTLNLSGSLNSTGTVKATTLNVDAAVTLSAVKTTGDAIDITTTNLNNSLTISGESHLGAVNVKVNSTLDSGANKLDADSITIDDGVLLTIGSTQTGQISSSITASGTNDSGALSITSDTTLAISGNINVDALTVIDVVDIEGTNGTNVIDGINVTGSVTANTTNLSGKIQNSTGAMNLGAITVNADSSLNSGTNHLVVTASQDISIQDDATLELYSGGNDDGATINVGISANGTNKTGNLTTNSDGDIALTGNVNVNTLTVIDGDEATGNDGLTVSETVTAKTTNLQGTLEANGLMDLGDVKLVIEREGVEADLSDIPTVGNIVSTYIAASSAHETIKINSITFNTGTTVLDIDSGTGLINLEGAVGSTGTGQSLTLNDFSGVTSVGGALTFDSVADDGDNNFILSKDFNFNYGSGDLTFKDNLKIGDDEIFSLTNIGHDITFNDELRSEGDKNDNNNNDGDGSVVLSTGSGVVSFNELIGSHGDESHDHTLKSLTINGVSATTSLDGQTMTLTNTTGIGSDLNIEYIVSGSSTTINSGAVSGDTIDVNANNALDADFVPTRKVSLTADNITISGDVTSLNSFELNGINSVLAVTTKGDQIYTGTTTLGGNLSGLNVTLGATTLDATTVTITSTDSSATSTGVITGAISGGDKNLNIISATHVDIQDEVTNLTSLDINAISANLNKVTTSGVQDYSGVTSTTTLNGDLTTTNSSSTITIGNESSSTDQLIIAVDQSGIATQKITTSNSDVIINAVIKGEAAENNKLEFVVGTGSVTISELETGANKLDAITINGLIGEVTGTSASDDGINFNDGGLSNSLDLTYVGGNINFADTSKLNNSYDLTLATHDGSDTSIAAGKVSFGTQLLDNQIKDVNINGLKVSIDGNDSIIFWGSADGDSDDTKTTISNNLNLTFTNQDVEFYREVNLAANVDLDITLLNSGKIKFTANETDVIDTTNVKALTGGSTNTVTLDTSTSDEGVSFENDVSNLSSLSINSGSNKVIFADSVSGIGIMKVNEIVIDEDTANTFNIDSNLINTDLDLEYTDKTIIVTDSGDLTSAGNDLALTAGAVKIKSDVVSLATLHINSTTSSVQNVTSAGTQTYSGTTTLKGDLTGSKFELGDVILGGEITITSEETVLSNKKDIVINSVISGAHKLTIVSDQTTGDVEIGHVGSEGSFGDQIGELIIIANTATLNNVYSTGPQDYSLASNISLNGVLYASSAGSDILFGANNIQLDSDTINLIAADTISTTGTITGNDTSDLSLTATTVSVGNIGSSVNKINSVTIASDSATVGAVYTDEAQNYSLVDDTTLNGNLYGGDITLGSFSIGGTDLTREIESSGVLTLNGSITAAGKSLNLTGDTSVSLNQGIATVNNLKNLTISSDGIVSLQAVETTGAQNYANVDGTTTLNGKLTTTSAVISDNADVVLNDVAFGTNTTIEVATNAGDITIVSITGSSGDDTLTLSSTSGSISIPTTNVSTVENLAISGTVITAFDNSFATVNVDGSTSFTNSSSTKFTKLHLNDDSTLTLASGHTHTIGSLSGAASGSSTLILNSQLTGIANADLDLSKINKIILNQGASIQTDAQNITLNNLEIANDVVAGDEFTANITILTANNNTVHIKGTVTGQALLDENDPNIENLTITATDGTVTVDGAVSLIETFTVNAQTINVSSVSTENSQTYSNEGGTGISTTTITDNITSNNGNIYLDNVLVGVADTTSLVVIESSNGNIEITGTVIGSETGEVNSTSLTINALRADGVETGGDLSIPGEISAINVLKINSDGTFVPGTYKDITSSQVAVATLRIDDDYQNIGSTTAGTITIGRDTVLEIAEENKITITSVGDAKIEITGAIVLLDGADVVIDNSASATDIVIKGSIIGTAGNLDESITFIAGTGNVTIMNDDATDNEIPELSISNIDNVTVISANNVNMIDFAGNVNLDIKADNLVTLESVTNGDSVKIVAITANLQSISTTGVINLAGVSGDTTLNGDLTTVNSDISLNDVALGTNTTLSLSTGNGDSGDISLTSITGKTADVLTVNSGSSDAPGSINLGSITRFNTLNVQGNVTSQINNNFNIVNITGDTSFTSSNTLGFATLNLFENTSVVLGSDDAQSISITTLTASTGSESLTLKGDLTGTGNLAGANEANKLETIILGNGSSITVTDKHVNINNLELAENTIAEIKTSGTDDDLSASSITIEGTITGQADNTDLAELNSENLTLTSTSGAVTLEGGVTLLENLTINSAQDTTVNNSINIAGKLDINAGSGASIFNSNATVIADVLEVNAVSSVFNSSSTTAIDIENTIVIDVINASEFKGGVNAGSIDIGAGSSTFAAITATNGLVDIDVTGASVVNGVVDAGSLKVLAGTSSTFNNTVGVTGLIDVDATTSSLFAATVNAGSIDIDSTSGSSTFAAITATNGLVDIDVTGASIVNGIVTAGSVEVDAATSEFKDTVTVSSSSEIIKNTVNVAGLLDIHTTSTDVNITTSIISGAVNADALKIDSNSSSLNSVTVTDGLVDIDVINASVVNGDVNAGSAEVDGASSEFLSTVNTASWLDINTTGSSVFNDAVEAGSIEVDAATSEFKDTVTVSSATEIIKNTVNVAGLLDIHTTGTPGTPTTSIVSGAVNAGAVKVVSESSSFEAITVTDGLVDIDVTTASVINGVVSAGSIEIDAATSEFKETVTVSSNDTITKDGIDVTGLLKVNATTSSVNSADIEANAVDFNSALISVTSVETVQNQNYDLDGEARSTTSITGFLVSTNGDITLENVLAFNPVEVDAIDNINTVNIISSQGDIVITGTITGEKDTSNNNVVSLNINAPTSGSLEHGNVTTDGLISQFHDISINAGGTFGGAYYSDITNEDDIDIIAHTLSIIKDRELSGAVTAANIIIGNGTNNNIAITSLNGIDIRLIGDVQIYEGTSVILGNYASDGTVEATNIIITGSITGSETAVESIIIDAGTDTVNVGSVDNVEIIDIKSANSSTLGAVTNGSTVTITSNSSEIDDISVSGDVNVNAASITGAGDVSLISTSSSGAINLNGTLTGLDSLTIIANNATLYSVTTTGNQDYSQVTTTTINGVITAEDGNVQFGRVENTEQSQIAVAGNVIVNSASEINAGGTGVNGLITINGTVDSKVETDELLTLNAENHSYVSGDLSDITLTLSGDLTSLSSDLILGSTTIISDSTISSATGDLSIGSMDINDGHTLTLVAAGSTTVKAIQTSEGSAGNLTINTTGAVNFEGAVALNNITIVNTSGLKFGNDVDTETFINTVLDYDIEFAGNTDINTVANFNNTGNIILNGDLTTNGQTKVTGNLIINNNSIITVGKSDNKYTLVVGGISTTNSANVTLDVGKVESKGDLIVGGDLTINANVDFTTSTSDKNIISSGNVLTICDITDANHLELNAQNGITFKGESSIESNQLTIKNVNGDIVLNNEITSSYINITNEKGRVVINSNIEASQNADDLLLKEEERKVKIIEGGDDFNEVLFGEYYFSEVSESDGESRISIAATDLVLNDTGSITADYVTLTATNENKMLFQAGNLYGASVVNTDGVITVVAPEDDLAVNDAFKLTFSEYMNINTLTSGANVSLYLNADDLVYVAGDFSAQSNNALKLNLHLNISDLDGDNDGGQVFIGSTVESIYSIVANETVTDVTVSTTDYQGYDVNGEAIISSFDSLFKYSEGNLIVDNLHVGYSGEDFLQTTKSDDKTVSEIYVIGNITTDNDLSLNSDKQHLSQSPFVNGITSVESKLIANGSLSFNTSEAITIENDLTLQSKNVLDLSGFDIIGDASKPNKDKNVTIIAGGEVILGQVGGSGVNEEVSSLTVIITQDDIHDAETGFIDPAKLVLATASGNVVLTQDIYTTGDVDFDVTTSVSVKGEEVTIKATELIISELNTENSLVVTTDTINYNSLLLKANNLTLNANLNLLNTGANLDIDVNDFTMNGNLTTANSGTILIDGDFFEMNGSFTSDNKNDPTSLKFNSDTSIFNGEINVSNNIIEFNNDNLIINGSLSADKATNITIYSNNTYLAGEINASNAELLFNDDVIIMGDVAFNVSKLLLPSNITDNNQFSLDDSAKTDYIIEQINVYTSENTQTDAEFDINLKDVVIIDLESTSNIKLEDGNIVFNTAVDQFYDTVLGNINAQSSITLTTDGSVILGSAIGELGKVKSIAVDASTINLNGNISTASSLTLNADNIKNDQNIEISLVSTQLNLGGDFYIDPEIGGYNLYLSNKVNASSALDLSNVNVVANNSGIAFNSKYTWLDESNVTQQTENSIILGNVSATDLTFDGTFTLSGDIKTTGSNGIIFNNVEALLSDDVTIQSYDSITAIGGDVILNNSEIDTSTYDLTIISESFTMNETKVDGSLIKSSNGEINIQALNGNINLTKISNTNANVQLTATGSVLNSDKNVNNSNLDDSFNISAETLTINSTGAGEDASNPLVISVSNGIILNVDAEAVYIDNLQQTNISSSPGLTVIDPRKDRIESTDAANSIATVSLDSASKDESLDSENSAQYIYAPGVNSQLLDIDGNYTVASLVPTVPTLIKTQDGWMFSHGHFNTQSEDEDEEETNAHKTKKKKTSNQQKVEWFLENPLSAL